MGKKQYATTEWVRTTDLDASGGELDADGGLGLEVELVTRESGEEVTLSDAGVADEDNWKTKKHNDNS